MLLGVHSLTGLRNLSLTNLYKQLLCGDSQQTPKITVGRQAWTATTGQAWQRLHRSVSLSYVFD